MKGCFVPKYTSDTQWSARADATEAVFRGYKLALQEVASDDNQTGDTQNQANTLAKQINTKEVAFMCELWNDIMQRFNKCSILLQNSSIELTTVVSLMKSLNNL